MMVTVMPFGYNFPIPQNRWRVLINTQASG
jgi:hypothetical protein